MDVRIQTEEYKFKYRVSGIIIKDNKILVDKYKEDTYVLPGGYVEIGETSKEAMNRELTEEVDKEFIIKDLKGMTENFFINKRGERTHAIELYYNATLKNEEDYNKIDFDREELDKGNLVQHHFRYLDLDKINDYKILPKEIKEYLNTNEFFHIIIKE